MEDRIQIQVISHFEDWENDENVADDGDDDYDAEHDDRYQSLPEIKVWYDKVINLLKSFPFPIPIWLYLTQQRYQ